MFHQSRRLTISFLLMAFFLLLTVLVLQQPHWFRNLDQLFWFLPQLRTPLGDQIILGFAAIATILPTTAVSVLLSIYLWRKKQRVWAIWVLGNLFLVSGIGQGVKWLVQRPRPAIEGGMIRDSYSFPSGHTLLATTLVITCLLLARFLVKKKATLSLIGSGFLLAVIFSRFYLGVHYPSDTLASLCLASGVTGMTYEGTRLFLNRGRGVDKPMQRRRS